jgi:phosphopantetheinyl transferase (holo-ACP synthase)
MTFQTNIQFDIQTPKGVIFIEKLTQKNLNKDLVNQKINDLLTNKLQIGEIRIDHLDSGQPFIENIEQLNISISHSSEWICIYISEDYAVGVDIEELNPKLEQIKTQFINTREEEIFIKPNLETLQLIWGAKESIYKYFAGEFTSLEKQVSIENIDFETKKIKAKSIYGWLECSFEQISEQVYLVWV